MKATRRGFLGLLGAGALAPAAKIMPAPPPLTPTALQWGDKSVISETGWPEVRTVWTATRFTRIPLPPAPPPWKDV